MKLNIVSLDNPYPPDYGGAIDIYYKLKSYVDMYRKGIRLPIWSKQDLDKLEALAKQTN